MVRIRIHQRDIQEKISLSAQLKRRGKQRKIRLSARRLEYGTPPHGGIAFGLDRMVMLMGIKKASVMSSLSRKTQSATDMMTQAPSPVDIKQLLVSHISTTNKEKKNSQKEQ